MPSVEEYAPRVPRVLPSRPAIGATLLLFGCSPAIPPATGAGTDVASAIADLAVPAREVAACTFLNAHAEAAVPALREALRSAADERLPERPTLLGLYVLAGLGAAAADAEPEIVAIYRRHPTAAVRQQAMWALARVVAPTRDAARCKRCEGWIRDCDAHDTDMDMCAEALALLALARDARHHRPEDILRYGGREQLHALAEAISAGWFDSPTALEGFRTQIEALHTHATRPWDARPRFLPVAPAMAESLWRAGERSPAIAAALLRHREATRRIDGIRALAEEDAWTSRAAIAGCLGDPDRSVRDAALAVVRAWGAAPLALPRLRRAAADSADPTFAAQCAQAADALLAAAIADADDATRQLLSSADAVLRGGTEPLAPPTEAPSRRALLELVRGSRGLEARGLEAFASAGREIAAEAEGFEAFVAWLGADTRDSWCAAADALVHCGPGLLRHEPQIESLVMESGDDAGRALATGLEVRAGAAADAAALAVAEATGPWHVTVRAWLERVRRGEAIPKATAQRARALAVQPQARVEQREDWGEARDGCYRGVDLVFDEGFARAAAALLRAAAGESGWRGDVPPATGDTIAEAVVAHGLPALAQDWIERLRALCLERH